MLLEYSYKKINKNKTQTCEVVYLCKVRFGDLLDESICQKQPEIGGSVFGRLGVCITTTQIHEILKSSVVRWCYF